MTEQEKRFLTHIEADDPLQIIVRGHLYVEAELTKLLYEALPKPGAIDLSRFPLKVDLAVALQLLWPEEKPAYIFLNKLRNKLAHNLDAEIGRTEEMEFFHTLCPRQRFAFGDHSPDDFETPELLRQIISVLFVSTAVQVQKLIESKAETARLHQEMQKLHRQVEELRRTKDR